MNLQKIKDIFLEHKTRIVTSIVMIAVIFAVVFIDSMFLTWAFLGVVYLLSFYEACEIFGIKEKRLYGIAGFIWLILAWYSQPIFLVLVVIMILVATMVQSQRFESKVLYPFFYPTISMALMFTLYAYFGMVALVWLVFIVASCDIGAYVVGKAIGKKQFSPTSPKKTWEGVLGGIIIATFVGTMVGMNIFSFWFSFTISFAVSVSAIWGDLFESYLKREANIKDSGSILPGHGGVLDRLDGYLFAAPMMLTLLEGLA